MDHDAETNEPDADQQQRFVVPDPGSPPDGEPTTFVPPAGAPGPPPGYPQSPPFAPPQSWDDQHWGTRQQPTVQNQGFQPAAQYPGYAQAPPPPPGGRPGGRRSGLAGGIVIGILIALLAAVGAFFGVRALSDSGGGFSATVDECHIASDGSLSASGTVVFDEDRQTTIVVAFDDSTDGSEIDHQNLDVDASAGEPVQWRASGQAPDDVDQVTCTVGPGD